MIGDAKVTLCNISRMARMMLLALPALLFIGCTMTESIPIFPTQGYFYTHIRAPLVLPGVADLGDTSPAKQARQLYIRIPTPYVPTEIALGRVDIETAARRGGIERLTYADYEFRSFLNYFKSMTIHAYGYGPAEPDSAALESEVGSE